MANVKQEKGPKKKKEFKMPHLLWIMVGMILVCSLLTYIIPAGQFAVDENGSILGDEFAFLPEQTPVDPVQAILDIFPGMTGSASVIFIVMICGACMEVFLATKTFDKLLDWATYKLQGKGQTLLISVLFCLMVYLGGFGGSDALIAIVPIGIVFAKKLRLDPIVAMGVSTFATLIGFGTGPTKTFVVQGLMGTRLYGAFGTRFLFMNLFMVVGLLMVLRYAKRVRKDPRSSLMYEEGWRPDQETEGGESQQEARLQWQTIVSILLFLGQFVFVTVYGLVGDANLTYNVMAGVMIVVCIVQGVLAGMSADEIGNAFAKGLASMAFVGFVIGLARTVSIVLTDGNILHTIVYYITMPLLHLPQWLSAIGMMLVIALINPIIPSATSKAAILVPIIKPIGEVLGLAPEVIVQAFQFGDGFTNIVSPLLGWTVGSLAMAKIPFNKWMKWALPKVLILLGISCILMFILTITGWTGSF